MNIEFGLDEIPSDGRLCSQCKLPIIGDMLIAYSVVGEMQEVKYFNYAICENCQLKNQEENSKGDS